LSSHYFVDFPIDMAARSPIQFPRNLMKKGQYTIDNFLLFPFRLFIAFTYIFLLLFALLHSNPGIFIAFY
jgi:hypothetical protein